MSMKGNMFMLAAMAGMMAGNQFGPDRQFVPRFALSTVI